MVTRSHCPTSPVPRAPRRPVTSSNVRDDGPGCDGRTLEALLTDWLTRVALASAGRREPRSEIDFCGRVEDVLETEAAARQLAARQLERLYARLRWFAEAGDAFAPGGTGSSTLRPPERTARPRLSGAHAPLAAGATSADRA